MSAHGAALPLELDPLIAEAKQRARRRRLLVAAALLVAGAAVGGVLALGSGGASGEVAWLPTRPQLIPANPPLAPACKASQLGATLGLQGATGNLAGTIEIRNRSSNSCALVGRPKLSFAAATSKWQETGRHMHSFFPSDPLAPPRSSLRALAPGGWASVGLFWSGWCGRGSNDGGNSGEPPSALLLTAPGGGTIRMARNRIGLGSRPLSAPPCYGGGVSTLSATRFTPVMSQGTLRSELPLRARMISSTHLSLKGEQPGFIAHRGAWLSYTVVLTNRGRRPFTFGQSCPVYTEQWGLSRAQAFVLNCRPVDSIGPGRSVRFAMRVYVPRQAEPYSSDFTWTLAPNTSDPPQAAGYGQLH